MKDCTTCKYGFVDERLGFSMCHHPKRFSEDCVDFNMHEDKEEPKKATGIEKKKLPDGLEEAAEESASQYYVDDGCSPFPNTETAAQDLGHEAWVSIDIDPDSKFDGSYLRIPDSKCKRCRHGNDTTGCSLTDLEPCKFIPKI